MGQNNSTPKQEFLPKATNKEIDFNVENLFKSSNTTPFMTAKYSPTSMISIDSIPAIDLSGGKMTRNIPLRKRYNEFNTGISNNNNNNNTYSSDDVIENLYGGKFNNELSELSHNNNVDMFFNNVESNSLASVSSNASLASLASVPNVANNTNLTNLTNVEPDDHYNNYSATSINSIFGGGATASASASASTKMSFSETSYNNSLNDVNQEANFEPDNDIQVLRNNILSATSPNPVQFMKGGADKEDDEDDNDDDDNGDDEDSSDDDDDDDEDDEDSSDDDSSDSDDEEKDKEDKNKDKKKVKKEEVEKVEVKPNNLSRSRPTTPTMNRKPTTPKNKKDDSSSSSSLSSSSFSTSSSSSDENNVNRTDKWSPHLSSSRQFQPAGNETYKLDSSSDEYKMNKRNYSSSDLHISNSDYLNKMRNRNRFS